MKMISTLKELMRSEIGKRFALYVAVLGVSMALVISSVASYRQYRNRVAFIEREVDSIVKTNKSSIEQSLWIFDTQSLRLIAKGFLLNDDIVFVQITDEKGKAVVSVGKPEENLQNSIVKRVALYHQEEGERIFLGDLTVVASKASAFRETVSSLVTIVLQSVLLMFIISVEVIYLFWRLVSRHLVSIKQYTRSLKLGKYQPPLTLDRPINKHTRNDELASVVEAINFMRLQTEKAYQATLEGWARMLEFRDRETEGHSRRVAKMSVNIAKKLGLDEEEVKYVYYGALLHDIGKIAIPDEILHKPGPLTPEERAIINQHPVYALEVLKDIEHLRPALAIPYSHHENWDGTGYPQGLKGEAIPLAARIFAVVDNLDALTTDRPYRKAWSYEEALEYIKEQRGKKFDPRIVDILVAYFEEIVEETD